jgi:hypothetical protein
MQTVLETDRNMELNPVTIYVKMINEAEIKTGEKTKLERQVTPEQVRIFFFDKEFILALGGPELKDLFISGFGQP